MAVPTEAPTRPPPAAVLVRLETCMRVWEGLKAGSGMQVAVLGRAASPALPAAYLGSSCHE